jgi:hypothetical protein
MGNKRLTLFVASPDSYSDVFEVFMQCYQKNCEDSPYELILATNTGQYKNITVMTNNNPGDNWIDRAIPALKRIDTKYILLMVDDIFIIQKVDFRKIERILDDMDEYQLNFCGLSNNFKGKCLRKGSILVYVKQRQAYAKNLQFGIFRRDYLISELGDGSKSGWDLEKKWVNETATASQAYFTDIVSCKEKIIKFVHGIDKGKWLPGALNSLKKNGIKVNVLRETLSGNEELKLNITKIIGKKFSPKNRRWIKNVLSRLGYKFITNN